MNNVKWVLALLLVLTAACSYAFPSQETSVTRTHLMEFFSDDTRWSCMLMGGLGGLPKDPDYPLFFHGGAAVNVRMKHWLQLYAGAGGDSVANALALQTGAYLSPFKWLGASANFKLVIGAEGVVPMASAALFVIGRYERHTEP